MTTETDRELLEWAANAAGLSFRIDMWDGAHIHRTDDLWEPWNPLTDDGDAMRLAVKLEIEVRNFNGKSHSGKQNEFWFTEAWFPDGDPYAATRRAIVRAAAAIGKEMKE